MFLFSRAAVAVRLNYCGPPVTGCASWPNGWSVSASPGRQPVMAKCSLRRRSWINSGSRSEKVSCCIAQMETDLWIPVVDYPQTNRKIDTGKTLTLWPVFVDHFTLITSSARRSRATGRSPRVSEEAPGNSIYIFCLHSMPEKNLPLELSTYPRGYFYNYFFYSF